MNNGMDWLIFLVVLGIFIFWFIWRGKQANEVEWDSPTINVIDGWMRIYCRKFQRLQSDPLELPENGGVLVVCNHVSGLEPLIKLTACKRPIRYLVATEDYHTPVVHWLLKGVGCIPVDRSGKPEVAFRAAIRALKDGEAIGIYPHGGFCLDDQQKAVKGGVLRLAKLTGARIIPTRVTGIRRPGNSYIPMFLRGNVKLQVFPTLDEDFLERPDAKQQLGDLLLGKIPAIEKAQD